MATESVDAARATYGEPSNDVLQSVMGVDPQPAVKEKADLQN